MEMALVVSPTFHDLHVKTLKLIATAAVTLAASLSAQAAFVVYTDAGAFAAAAGTVSTETFASAPVSYTTSNYSQAFSSFTLSSVANGDHSGVRTGGANQYYGWGQAALNGSYTGNGNVAPTSTFTLTNVSAFGFDFFNNDPTDSYNIHVNGADVGDINTSSSGFFGVVATAGDVINQVVLSTRSYGGVVDNAGIDNVRVSANNVPEPSALLLTAGALVALGFGSRRKNRR